MTPTATIAPSEPARPLDWCDRCSAAWVRCTDAGELLCWYHWLDHVIARWIVRAPEPEWADRLLDTMVRAPRPPTASQLIELIGYHPLRTLSLGERVRFEEDLGDEVRCALDYFVQRGVLVAIAGGRYVWSATAKELLPPTCVGTP